MSEYPSSAWSSVFAQTQNYSVSYCAYLNNEKAIARTTNAGELYRTSIDTIRSSSFPIINNTSIKRKTTMSAITKAINAGSRIYFLILTKPSFFQPRFMLSNIFISIPLNYRIKRKFYLVLNFCYFVSVLTAIFISLF